jgi:hypothetical protein
MSRARLWQDLRELGRPEAGTQNAWQRQRAARRAEDLWLTSARLFRKAAREQTHGAQRRRKRSYALTVMSTRERLLP